MKYKAVIFDNVGVILNENHKNWSKRIAEYYNLPFDSIYQSYSRQKAWQLFKRGKISETEFWQQGNKKLGKKLDLKILKKMARRARRPRKLVVKLIKKLKNNYVLGLLNNEGREWDNYSFQKNSFYSLFDIHLASYHFGVAKPKERIYKILIKKLKKYNIKPEETVYIDDYLENLKSAKKLGFVTIHYKSYNELYKSLKKLQII
ncbi:MAG: HAD-IA family hydrolase [Patescibacteria group bacterium]|nr:HAD-IA family hydrolase [Patescibacteria group bacterium]